MHQFQLLTPTAAKLHSLTPRIEKHGEENVPAVSLGLTITGPNTLLDLLQPGLREAVYKAVEGQEALPGVDAPTPLMRSRAVERIKLKLPEMEGWQLVIEHGIDDDSAIDLHGCKVDAFAVEPFEGGSVELRFRVGTSDVDETYMGHLAMKLGREVSITLHAPQPKADAIDGSNEAFQKDHPDAGKTAADLFEEAHGEAEAALGDEPHPADEPKQAGRRSRKNAAEVEVE